MRIVPVLMFLAACGNEPVSTAPAPNTVTPAAPAPPPARKKTDAEKTVADVAVESPDHTTLVTALTAAGLVTALNSPGGIYTVFAPNNAAFAELPAGTVEGLLAAEDKSALAAILKHHATVPIIPMTDLKDGMQIAMSDGKKVTVHVQGDQVRIDDALILGTVQAMNGVVYVVDSVILPPG
jgi:uncharacterized surface protein with fasciclin (FAS1) repeats